MARTKNLPKPGPTRSIATASKKTKKTTVLKTVKKKQSVPLLLALPAPPVPAEEQENKIKKKRRFRKITHAKRNIEHQQKNSLNVPGTMAGRSRVFRMFLQQSEKMLNGGLPIDAMYKRSSQDVLDIGVTELLTQLLANANKITERRKEKTVKSEDLLLSLKLFCDFNPNWDTVMSDFKQYIRLV